MDAILNEVVDPADLKKFELMYNEQVHRGQVSEKAKFEYAWCLVRSKYIDDMKEGVALLEVWKIVPPTRADSHIPPYEFKNTYEEFKHDDRCHSEILRLAGEPTLNYLLGIDEGKLDFICRIPREAQIRIILNMDLEDIQRLGRTCKKFRELCHSCELWERIYRKYSETPITPELEMLAQEKGWRRLFFTNKLQLQMQLRRLKKHEGGHAFVTEMETA